MKSLLSRLLVVLLVLGGLYLVIVNAALNLPATRAWLNDMQPEQFSVDWQRAWSPYPLRVILTGLAADGQTPTEQWQVDAARAGASVSLPALLRGEVRIHDLDLTDIDLRLRPLRDPNADAETAREQQRLAPYYPVIRNRDPSAPAEPVPEETDSALVLEIDDLSIHGEHRFWVAQLRGTLPGEVRGSFRMDAGTSTLSLADGSLDLRLRDVQVGPEAPVDHDAFVKGRVDIPPVRLTDTQGLALMRVPDLDAAVDLPVLSLDFLSWLMPGLGGLDLHGAGRLRGRVMLSAGEVLPGTDLVVEAHELAMDIGRFDFRGDGQVEFAVDPDDTAQADLTVRFDQVQAALDPAAGSATTAADVLFTGRGLTARVHVAERDPATTSAAQEVAALEDEVLLSFTLDIPSMRVDDLAVYNRLFPDTWDLDLGGGTGTVQGGLAVTEERLSLELDLASDEADLRAGPYHANSDLLIQLRAVVADPDRRNDSATLDIAGTRVRIEDAEVDQAADAGDDAAAQHWTAELRVDKADLSVVLPDAEHGRGPVLAAAKLLRDRGFGDLLSQADGGADVAFTLSRLDWIAALLGRPLGLGLSGSSELDAEIRLDDGLPAAGSALRIPREALSVRLLEHQIDGTGEASLTLQPGAGKDAGHPRARLSIALDDGRAHREDEDEPSVGDVRLDAVLLVRDPFAGAPEEAAERAELALTIHSARVPDMRTYNDYLPADGPVQLLGGAASLVGNLSVQAERAEGELVLTADAIELAVAEQSLSGNLRLELLIRDGAAEELRFDITGSSLLLDGFRVAGATAATSDGDWSARLQFEDTEILWQKPMQLSTRADITVKDTRPFVALLDNVRGKQGWVDELVTIEDLAGHLVLRVDGDEAVIEDAMLSGPEIGVHAKGQAGADTREGMLLLRWHNLLGALELEGEQKHFNLINARARFDAYRPGEVPLASVRNAAADGATAEDGLEPMAAGQVTRSRKPSAREPDSQGRSSREHSQPASVSPFDDHSL